MSYKYSKGFTLIELLLVAAIVSVLASIFMFNASEAKDKAEDAHMVSESRQLENAIAMYKGDNGYVPHDTTVTAGEMYLETDTVNYEKVLKPLVDGGYYSEIPRSPDGKSYAYGFTSDFQDFIFIAGLNRGGSHSVPCKLSECSYVISEAGSGTESSTYTLNIIPAGGASSLRINSVMSADFSARTYPAGTILEILAYNSYGSAYGWNGCDNYGSGNCSIVMDENKTISPIFYFSLQISSTGSGTVVYDVASTYPDGAVKILTANPSSGATFQGWGGDASSCGTQLTCSILINSNKNITASFSTI